MTPPARARVAPGPATDVVALHHRPGTPRGAPAAASKARDSPDAELDRGGMVQPVPRATEAQAAPPPRAVTQYHAVPTHRPSWAGRSQPLEGSLALPVSEPGPGLLRDRPLSAPVLPGEGLVALAPCLEQGWSHLPPLGSLPNSVWWPGLNVSSGWGLSAATVYRGRTHVPVASSELFGGSPRPPGGQVGWRHVGQGRGCVSG